MTAARILRRLARRATKPLRLAIIRSKLTTSDQNIAYYKQARDEATELIAAEHRNQVALMLRQRDIERGAA